MNTLAVNPWDTLLAHSTTSPIMRAPLLSWNTFQDEEFSLNLEDDSGKDKLKLLITPFRTRDSKKIEKYQECQ